MSIYYTYLIKCLPTNEYYYGVRYCKNSRPDDLWVKYFTSSKIVKSMIKKYGKESFSYEIRKTFDDPIKARMWEYKVIRRMNLVKRTDFLNKSDGVLFYSREGSTKGHISIQIIETGKYKLVPKHKAIKLINDGKAIKKGSPKPHNFSSILSKSLKGKKKSQKHINNLSKSLKGKIRGSWCDQYGAEEAKKKKRHLSKILSNRESSYKGKTYEELYGEEKAKKVKNLRSIQFTNSNPGKNMKGKTYEELYGEEKAKHLKEIRSKARKAMYKIYFNNCLEDIVPRENIPDIFFKLTGKKISGILYNKSAQEKYNILIIKDIEGR